MSARPVGRVFSINGLVTGGAGYRGRRKKSTSELNLPKKTRVLDAIGETHVSECDGN